MLQRRCGIATTAVPPGSGANEKATGVTDVRATDICRPAGQSELFEGHEKQSRKLWQRYTEVLPHA